MYVITSPLCSTERKRDREGEKDGRRAVDLERAINARAMPTPNQPTSPHTCSSRTGMECIHVLRREEMMSGSVSRSLSSPSLSSSGVERMTSFRPSHTLQVHTCDIPILKLTNSRISVKFLSRIRSITNPRASQSVRGSTHEHM